MGYALGGGEQVTAMPLRFFSRKTLIPGVRLNMSRSGPSISIGPRGLSHTIGPRGRRTTVGLPGTGLHYSMQHGKSKKTAPSKPKPQASSIDPDLAQAETDRQFLRAVIAFQRGAGPEDLQVLDGMEAADAHWVLGMAAFRNMAWPKAERHLRSALRGRDLGELCARNGVTMQMPIEITPEVTAHAEPTPFATQLALVEALQAQGKARDGLKILKTMNADVPDDFVVAMSLAEIAFEVDDGRTISMENLADILSRATPGPNLVWAAAFWEARARARSGEFERALGLYEVAKSDGGVPDDVRMLAWYEMALTYAEAGETIRCRQELSAIHAQDSSFLDVDARLRGRA